MTSSARSFSIFCKIKLVKIFSMIQNLLLQQGVYQSRKATELKVAGAHLSVKINGRATRVWIDSGCPISNFTVGELRSTRVAQNVKLESLTPEDTQLCNASNAVTQLW